METYRQIHFEEVDLYDSHIIRYEFNNNTYALTVEVETWNAGILTIVFQDFIGLEVYTCGEMHFLREALYKTPLLTSALEQNYEVIPSPYEEKHYEFVNVDDNPFLKIIASSYTYQFKPYVRPPVDEKNK